jgi:hypothetical protein
MTVEEIKSKLMLDSPTEGNESVKYEPDFKKAMLKNKFETLDDSKKQFSHKRPELFFYELLYGQTGRTTETIILALSKMSERKTVFIQAHNMYNQNKLRRRLKRYAAQLEIPMFYSNIDNADYVFVDNVIADQRRVKGMQ